LLGASNLTRGIATVVETASRVWGRPLDVLGAFGHGRSYGLDKAVLGRRLPAITACGLWEALGRRLAAPTAALLTDVGNDLLYEVDAPQIAAWVECCLDRLQALGARVVMTGLPTHALERLSRPKYLLLRTLLFPGSRLSLTELTRRTWELDRRLRQAAHHRGVPLVSHRAQWYGFDPIHIKLRHWGPAWREILAQWSADMPLPELPRPALGRWLYLRLLPPQQRWFFGWEQRWTQPAGRLADGTSLAFY
jgi:hypothetical protein